MQKFILLSIRMAAQKRVIEARRAFIEHDRRRAFYSFFFFILKIMRKRV